MHTSEAIDKLFPALVSAQAAGQVALKESTNPHFRSKYADLQSVWEAVSDALEKNDLAIIQAPGRVENGQIFITTRIIHKSGQWLESEASTPLPKQDPQGYGSAVTYMRRYTVSALMGIVSGEDDDGNAASQPAGEQQAPAPSANDYPHGEEGEPIHMIGTVQKVWEGQKPKPHALLITDDQGREIRAKGWADALPSLPKVGSQVEIDGVWTEFKGKWSVKLTSCLAALPVGATEDVKF